jgi:hypothetical protein
MAPVRGQACHNAKHSPISRCGRYAAAAAAGLPNVARSNPSGMDPIADSVLVVDLPAQAGAPVVVRGWFPVPAVRARRGTAAAEALEAAAGNAVGGSRHT